VFQALLVFLEKTWPRAASYANQALSTLLRLLMGLTQDPPLIRSEKCNRDQTIVLVGQCLQILSSAAPEKCQELLKGVEDVPASEEFLQILKVNT